LPDYDLGRNTGFVNMGTEHDTGALAVASIGRRWRAEGRRPYPRVRRLLITAVVTASACGCGNGSYRASPTRLG
jgi:hypothetical protein